MGRVLVTLPEKIEKIIAKDLMGLMGSTKAEVCRSIILNYLIEKKYIKSPSEKTDQ